MNEHLISRVPLFESLPPDEIQLLARTLLPAAFPAGAILFREGEYGNRFHVLVAGEIEIVKALDAPEERVVGVRGPGEYIGEMSLLSQDGRRTASARARTSAETLVMTRADFDTLLARRPTLAYAMVRVLSQRLSQAHNTTIQDLQAKNRQLSEAYQALQAAQAQLVEKEKLEHELHVAREVQTRLLPRRTPQLAGWDFAAAWEPAREVSGDFYDFIPLPGLAAEAGPAARWGIVIADVSGKGMPAALYMALARSTVRASVAGARQPAECMSQANRLLHADSGQGMFVTLFYAQLDPASGEVVYVNAGHNPPWVYRAGGDEWRELTRTSLALGMLSGAPVRQDRLRLQPGDFMLLYTDGLIDSANPRGERLEAAAVRAVVHACRRAPAAEIAARLEAAAAEFRAGQPLYDDITVVVMKRV
jgi:serine phosphatase RsbU (regulator of sigma subunit)